MPWCPKCKNEYREGFKVCADCGCDLVEEYVNQIMITMGAEQVISTLKQYLEYNKLRNVSVIYDKKQDQYALLVREKDKDKATQLLNVFAEQQMLAQARKQMEKGYTASGISEESDAETEEETNIEETDTDQTGMEQTEAVSEEKENKATPKRNSGVYMNSKERAEDNRSSAWTLLIIGGLGMVFMILGMLDMLPIHVGNPYMFYGVMSAIFILFIVMGFVSMKNARFFEKNAESEDSLKDTLLKWCYENLTVEAIDQYIDFYENIPEEEIYLRRSVIMKHLINQQFMNLDQGFVDELIDNELYDKIFETIQSHANL